MDIKFKSLGDVKSVLEALEITLQDLVNLFDLQKQQIQAKLKIKADVFLLDQPEAPVAEVLTDGQIKVPGGVQKITDSYSLLIELQEQLDTLQQASVAVDIQFAEEPKAQQVLDEIARVKGKVIRQYHEVADFLNDVPLRLSNTCIFSRINTPFATTFRRIIISCFTPPLSSCMTLKIKTASTCPSCTPLCIG